MYSEDSVETLPVLSGRIKLSDKKKEMSRSAYTFFMMIGDMGGFYGAVVGAVSYAMSWYSARMFQTSVFAEMPYKKRKNRSKRRANALRKKLESG